MMNKRIFEIRKELELTQAEFAEKINLTKNFVWMIEKGERIPSDRTISDICDKFNVNEHWLRTGEGEKFNQLSRDEEIGAFIGKLMKEGNDDFRRRLISVLSRLDANEWKLLEKMALSLVEEMKKADQ